jgi:hypothetical protein
VYTDTPPPCKIYSVYSYGVSHREGRVYTDTPPPCTCSRICRTQLGTSLGTFSVLRATAAAGGGTPLSDSSFPPGLPL